MRTKDNDKNKITENERIAQSVRKKTAKGRKRKAKGKKSNQKIKLNLSVPKQEKKTAAVEERQQYMSFEELEAARARKAEARKKRLEKARKRRKITLLVLLAIVLVIFFFNAPFFKIKSITCEGNNFVSDSEIISASGIGKGYNIYRTSFNLAEKNVLKIPFIHTVSFKRIFPNKVEITVTERQISAYFSEGATFVCIDSYGKILETTESVPTGRNVPEIHGLEAAAAKDGEMTTSKTDGKVEFVSAALTAMEKCGLIENVTSIDITDVSNMTFMINDKLKITMGKNENTDYKISFLVDKTFKNLGMEAAGFLDVSNGKEGVYRETERNIDEIVKEAEQKRKEEEERQKALEKALAEQNGETVDDEDEESDESTDENTEDSDS